MALMRQIPKAMRAEVRAQILALVDEALEAPELRIASSAGFTDEQYDEAGPIPIFRMAIRATAGEAPVKRLELSWAAPAAAEGAGNG